MTLAKHWKHAAITLLAAILAAVDFLGPMQGYNRPVAIVGAVVFGLLVLFVLFMIGRLKIYLLKTYPLQLIAIGVWLLVLMVGSVFVAALTNIL